MERISLVLKLSTNGTVDFMRTQILEYAEKNNAEDKIRDLAQQHKQIETKKTRAMTNQICTSSPALPTCNPSQSMNTPLLPPISPSLFSNYNEFATQDDSADVDPVTPSQLHHDIDELTQMGNDLTLCLEQSEYEREKRDPNPQCTPKNSYPSTVNARQRCPLPSTIPINDSMWDDGELNLGNVQEKKMGFMIDESKKIIAAKDRQIIELQESLKTMSDMNAQMSENYERHVLRLSNENDETRKLISVLIREVQEEKNQRQQMQTEFNSRDQNIMKLLETIKEDIGKNSPSKGASPSSSSPSSSPSSPPDESVAQPIVSSPSPPPPPPPPSSSSSSTSNCSLKPKNNEVR